MDNIVEGDRNIVSGMNARVIGNNNNVSGMDAHVTGNNNVVSGMNAVVVGRNNTVTGMDSVSTTHEGGENLVSDSSPSNYVAHNFGTMNISHMNPDLLRMFHGRVDFGDSSIDFGVTNRVVNYGNMVGSSTRARSRSPVRTAVNDATKFPSETATDTVAAEGETLCYICLVNKSVVVAYRCRHEAGCVACCRRLIEHGAKSSSGKHTCPECRAEVIEFIKTFTT